MFEVFASARMLFFGVLAPCRLVGRCHRFGKTYCLHLQCRRLEFVSLLMEAASTCETSVVLYRTALRNIPQDSHLHTRRRENLKSHRVSNLSSKQSIRCLLKVPGCEASRHLELRHFYAWSQRSDMCSPRSWSYLF
jgi:hypothetical protein